MSSKSHAVSSPTPPIPFGAHFIHQVPAAVDNLCWLIEYAPKRVAVVDGPGADELLSYLSAHELTLTHVLNTHTHGDHIGVNRALERAGLLAGLEVWGSAAAPVAIPGLTRALEDGERLTLGALELEVMRTEGHLNGHISFVVTSPAAPGQAAGAQARALFCGDTLFCGGCGYVFDGPMSVMAESLDRLAALYPDTLVCCAHEYTLDNLHFALSVEPDNAALQARAREVIALRAEGRSTVPSRLADELATNPFLRSASPTLIRAVGGQASEGRAALFERTRRLKDSKAYRAQPLEELLASTAG